MLDTIRTMATTASGGITGSMRRASWGTPCFNRTPTVTGTTTTCRTFKSNAQASTGTY